jgi:hypothetical protein
MRRIAALGAVGALTLSVLLAQLDPASSLHLTLLFAVYALFLTTAAAFGAFVANSGISSNAPIRILLGVVSGAVTGVAVVILSFFAYLFMGGPIH